MFRKRPIRPDLDARLRAFRFSPSCLSRLTALAMLAISGSAAAQVSGSVSLVSNYIYRGSSFSNDNPEAQLNLTADFDSGWFAGLFVSPVDLPGIHGQAIAYGGYAHQWTGELSWEAGVSESAYTGGTSQNYTEAFVGLSTDRLNGRLYYSPNYLGDGVRSIYGELNYNVPLTEKLRFTAHVGYLDVGLRDDASHKDSHGDTRVGLAYHAGDWNLQWALASVRETAVYAYRAYDNTYYYQRVTRHYAGVFDASWNF
ncbi:MAG TPA: TorF family putative porin [Burkholderiaceae bacterium]